MECPGPVESGRNFRLLSEEELPQLLEFLNGYLPESLKFHQTVLTYINNKVWDFYFYVANDWPEVPVCLHFPGMTLSPHGLLYESFGVYCPTDKLDNLSLLRDEDILIDWTKPLYINFIHCDIADELFRLYNDIGTIERVLGDVWAYKKFDSEDNEDESTSLMNESDEKYDNEQELKQSDEQQDIVEVLPLNSEHAEGIHELYPANDMECHELFLRLIRILPAGGVFVNNVLAAWMIQSYYGAMFSMQTKPEYRRKGYGTRLARFLTKVVSDRGYIPFVVIRPENEASQSLYKKLGFHKLYQTVRATMTPHGWEEEAVGIVEELDQVQKKDSDCEKFDNIVRKLRIEERVIDAFTSENDEQTVVPTVGQDDDDNTILDTSESPKDEDDNELEGENGYGKCHDEVLEPIDENVEDKITDDCDSG